MSACLSAGRPGHAPRGPGGHLPGPRHRRVGGRLAQRRAPLDRPGHPRQPQTSCPGSSTPTRWSSPRCSCWAARSATATAGAARCSPASASSAPARWPRCPSTDPTWLIAHARRAGRRCCAGHAGDAVHDHQHLPARAARPGRRRLGRRRRRQRDPRAARLRRYCSSSGPGVSVFGLNVVLAVAAIVADPAGHPGVGRHGRAEAGPGRCADHRARARHPRLLDHRGAEGRLGQRAHPGRHRRRAGHAARFIAWELRRPAPAARPAAVPPPRVRCRHARRSPCSSSRSSGSSSCSCSTCSWCAATARWSSALSLVPMALAMMPSARLAPRGSRHAVGTRVACVLGLACSSRLGFASSRGSTPTARTGCCSPACCRWAPGWAWR